MEVRGCSVLSSNVMRRFGSLLAVYSSNKQRQQQQHILLDRQRQGAFHRRTNTQCCMHWAQLLQISSRSVDALHVAACRAPSQEKCSLLLLHICCCTCHSSGCALQVLRCRRLHASAPAAAGKASRGGLHSMVTLQLDSYSADRELLASATLSFVELAAPEPKVRRMHAASCCKL
jgi:hypothetical protein